MYKIEHGISAVKLNDLGVLPLSNRHTRSYGSGLIACAPISSVSVFNFAHRTCKLWNMLPKKVLLMSLSQFKCYIYNINQVLWHRGINFVTLVFIKSLGSTNKFLLLLLLLLKPLVIIIKTIMMTMIMTMTMTMTMTIIMIIKIIISG